MTVKGGFLIIISGPSGVGKSSITSSLLSDTKNLDFSISCTTRERRASEKDLEDYRFISKEEFQRMIDENLFLEHEIVHGNFYGTPIEPIHDSLKFNHSILLDIDVKGASTVINTNHFDCVSIFVKPPSIEVLRKRLIERSDMSENKIEGRIEEAKNELTKSTYFNHMVINEDLDDCLHDIRRILMSL